MSLENRHQYDIGRKTKRYGIWLLPMRSSKSTHAIPTTSAPTFQVSDLVEIARATTEPLMMVDGEETTATQRAVIDTWFRSRKH